MANRKKTSLLVRVTVSFDPVDYKAFETLAAKEDRSTAYLICQAMWEYLSEPKRRYLLSLKKAAE